MNDRKSITLWIVNDFRTNSDSCVDDDEDDDDDVSVKKSSLLFANTDVMIRCRLPLAIAPSIIPGTTYRYDDGEAMS